MGCFSKKDVKIYKSLLSERAFMTSLSTNYIEKNINLSINYWLNFIVFLNCWLNFNPKAAKTEGVK